MDGKFILRYRQVEEEWGRYAIRSFIGGRTSTRAARILNNNFEIESAADDSIMVCNFAHFLNQKFLACSKC